MWTVATTAPGAVPDGSLAHRSLSKNARTSPAEVVADRINPAVGVVEAVDRDTCVLSTGADSITTLAVYLGMLDVDFEVKSPPELVSYLRALSDRYARAT